MDKVVRAIVQHHVFLNGSALGLVSSPADQAETTV